MVYRKKVIILMPAVTSVQRRKSSLITKMHLSVGTTICTRNHPTPIHVIDSEHQRALYQTYVKVKVAGKDHTIPLSRTEFLSVNSEVPAHTILSQHVVEDQVVNLLRLQFLFTTASQPPAHIEAECVEACQVFADGVEASLISCDQVYKTHLVEWPTEKCEVEAKHAIAIAV